MKRLTVTNNKGGVGKTTLGVLLAHRAAQDGRRVLFMDSDVQGNATAALSRVMEGEISPVKAFEFFTCRQDFSTAFSRDRSHGIYVIEADSRLADLATLDPYKAIDNFTSNLTFFEKDFDLMIFDTSPTFSVAMVIVTAISEKVLIPVEPDHFSLRGAMAFATQLVNTRRKLSESGLRCDMSVLGMVVNRHDLNRPRKVKMLEELRQKLGSALLKTTVCNRDAICAAMTEGCALSEIRTRAAVKAVAEIDALYAEVMGALHL